MNNSTTKALIVYFSQTGNTKVAAEKIHDYTGADIFRIEAKEPYNIRQVMQWSDRVDIEGKANAFPEIKSAIPNWDSYNFIYLGFPVWFWGAPTRIMATLFKTYDFTNKKVAPFYTSYSTDVNEAIPKLKRIAEFQKIDFLPGYRYEGDDKTLKQWIDEVKSLSK